MMNVFSAALRNKLTPRWLFLQEAERTLCQLSSVCFCFITTYKTLVNQRPNTRLHPQSTHTRPAGRLQTELVRKYNTIEIKLSPVFYNQGIKVSDEGEEEEEGGEGDNEEVGDKEEEYACFVLLLHVFL